MALDKNRSQDQAGGGAAPADPVRGPSFSLSQRFSFGVNVAVMVAAAAALLLLVNWIAKREYYQNDWSSLGRYSVSELTAKIVASIDEPIQITLLYDSQDPDKSRAEYQPRVYDLATELRRIGQDVTVTDVSTPADRDAFASRMQKSQGASADAYEDLVRDFTGHQDALAKQLSSEQASLAELANSPDAWIGNFRQLPQAVTSLGTVSQGLRKAINTIDKQATGGLMIAFDKQTEAVRSFVGPSLEDIKAVQRDVADLNELATKMNKDEGGAIAGTRNLSGQVDQVFAALQTKMPVAATTQPAAEPLSYFRQAAADLRKIAELMTSEQKLLSQFVDDLPAARGMASWPVMLSLQGLPIGAPRDRYFAKVAADLRDLADQFEQAVPQLNPEAIRKALPALVQQVAYERNDARQLFAETQAVLESMGKADPASLKLLSQGADFLAEASKTLEAFKGRLDKLPELKSGGLAEQLKQDNLVIVEVGDQEPRVLSFDDVWPQRGGFEPPPGMENRKRERPRDFNGDSALGAALFAASHKPIAEVVIVHYAQAPSYPMMQQQDEGDLPLSQLNTLRERLTAANVKVNTWNLAAEPEPPPPAYADDEEAKKQNESATTQPDEAKEQRTPLTRVYVLLPPPPPMPQNPYSPQPQGGFGPQHAAALAEALSDGGRALFLASWTGPRPYAWGEYLAYEWGLDVQTDYRINLGAATSEAGQLRLNQEQIIWMPMNHFETDTRIGKPLANRRILLLNACPIEETDKKPEGVDVKTILRVPYGETTYFATRDLDRLLEDFYGALPFEIGPDDKLPPLKVMIQAERQPTQEGQTAKSRLVVFAAGQSLADGYMAQPVRRKSKAGDINDPPPSADAEIVINSVYWLAGQEEWIASGPIPIPPIRVEREKLLPIQVMVVGAWPLLVLLVGGAVALWRRKF